LIAQKNLLMKDRRHRKMILSKANLSIHSIIKSDKTIPSLDTLHIREDGTTIAANGSAIVAVSPVSPEVRKSVPLDESACIGASTIFADTVAEVLKNMPRDSTFGGILEHCDFKNVGGEFTITDGKRLRRIAGKLFERDYIDYRAIYQRAHKETRKARCALNLKRLRAMLDAIESAVADSSSDSAIFIEFTEADSVIFRAQNSKTAQKILGIMCAYTNAEEAWQKYDEWEESMLSDTQKMQEKKNKIRREKA
jgi:hypothetical protein